jgi:hypothetical protein
MAFKTMRQRRYTRLIESGFTRGEARGLSAIPLTRVPYMKDLIRLRKTQVKEWIKAGEVRTRQQLNAKVREWYIKKGFVKPTHSGFFKEPQAKDVWQLLRWIEHEFGWKYPTYVSPFRRKRRDFVPFRGR